MGGNSEGIYFDTTSFAFVSPDGLFARQFLVGTIWGSLGISGLNWTFNPGTIHLLVGESPVTGSGTFSPKVSMDGSYSYGEGSPRAFGPMNYSPDNALAVSQASVSGRWSNLASDVGSGIGLRLEVSDAGTISGTTQGTRVGNCTIGGQLLQFEEGSGKNLYRMVFQVEQGAPNSEGFDAAQPCKMSTSGFYAGMAAITFKAAGVFDSNGYHRRISFLVLNGDGSTLSAHLGKDPS